MAPELFNGSRVDEAADVYSLGCILYECMARRRPFGELSGDDARSFNLLLRWGDKPIKQCPKHTAQPCAGTV
jgi:serine/threonine protein kinase